MFGLFTRSRPHTRRSRPKSVRLRLEQLEARDCPAGGSATPPISITAFNATVLNVGHQVELSGTVQDTGGLAGITVYFSGVCTGNTTVNAATGNFDYTTNASSLNNVFAIAVDPQNNQSLQVSSLLDVAPPQLTLNVSYNQQRSLTMSGGIVAAQNSGLTVSVGGVVSGSATSNSQGNYTVTDTASGPGQVTAQTTDVWGQNSNVATVNVPNGGPQITSFSASQSYGNMWTFSGSVTDPSGGAAGLIVLLGGSSTISGLTATVTSGGSFSASKQLPVGTNFVATAQTTDWWGQQSNFATTMVSP
jgi:hypothetical protein